MSEKTKSVETPLASLLLETLRFCRIQDQLYQRAMTEVAQQERFRAAADARSEICYIIGFVVALLR